VNKVDREALKRALALLRNDPEYRCDQIADKLKDQPWEDVAHFCAYCCQIDNLGLRPWQDPPMHAELSPDQPDALTLLVKLVGAGLSRFEPDPVAALAQVRIASPVVPKG
jgi:hypothetical protein